MSEEPDLSPLLSAYYMVPIIAIVLSASISWLWKKRSTQNSFVCNIPWAKGGIPLLGHALAYTRDPPSFICKQEKMLGPIFRIDLAGRIMIVIGSSPEAMRHIATLPSSVMSSEKAIAELGFEYTLGKTNVFKGTAWHKRILKDEIMSVSKFESTFLPNARAEISRSLQKEIKRYASQSDEGTVFIPDLFAFVRRYILRAMMNQLVGLSIDDNDEEEILLDEIMKFQDCVEDATAKAAVMSNLLARPLVLRPVEKKRQKLEVVIAAYIEDVWNKNPKRQMMGPWLQTFYDGKVSSQEAATLVIGLMFAAHKNPAIGAAQSFCYLHSEGSKSDLKQAQLEARTFLQDSECSIATLLQAKTLRCYILETLRVTSHTLGSVRKACEDVVVRNGSREYMIPKGSTVVISHIAPHRNFDIWKGSKCAEDFDPRRIEWNNSTPTATIGNPVDNYKMTAFSHGVHKCPGERLALSLIQIVFASLIDKKVAIIGAVPDVSFERATLAQRCAKVPVKIIL